ncbi:MAG: hypothetical protein E3J56_12710 [Candidatus Aminicenantes bacterium]|nr:MAG: hypothetical protein E3J56_12710 [Candidatus Aminicenantes bacterium]
MLRDLKQLSVSQLKDEADRLREQYDQWKETHPNQQDEEVINQFLLIKKELEKRGQALLSKTTDLDLDVQALTEIAKIKPIPWVPTDYTFSDKGTFERPHKCKYCDIFGIWAVIWAEGRAFIPVCEEHKEKAIHKIEVENKDKVEKIIPLPEKSSEYAPVHSSGKGDGDVIKLNDIEDLFSNFVISIPTVSLVGGIVTHSKDGTENDIDVLINIPSQEELERIIQFRIYRMFPEGLRERLHLLCEEKGGLSPFTDFLPLFKLVMERISEAEIVEMGEEEIDLFGEIRLRTKNVEKQIKEAEKALKSDKITPGEFWLMAKPVRAYYPDKAQSIDLFLDIYDEHYEYPSLSSKKYDGEHLSVHKIGDKVKIFSEDGKVLPELPNLKKEITELKPEVCVLEAELENWDYTDKNHLPRETVHTGVKDDNFTANVFDVLYYKGEVPDELWKEIEIYDKNKEEWKQKYI